MNPKRLIWTSLAAALLLSASVGLARSDGSRHDRPPAQPLVDTVRSAADRFRDIDEATAAGYGLFEAASAAPKTGPWAFTT